MSGIFKGDSIYKSGGGGGGFKDGGQLIDGGFIEVKNNTVSSYDNVSRDPVNFYIEVKDGEILNSVVELTTAVNATINVYVLRNGLYYLLGNVGGKTVTAGNDYNINIIGDSYAIDQVSSNNNDPSFAEINGHIYALEKIGGQLYTKEDYNGSFGENKYSFDNQTGRLNPNTGVHVDNYYWNGSNIGHMYRIRAFKTFNSGDGYSDFLDKFNESVYPFRLPKHSDSIFTTNCNVVSAKLNFNKFGYVYNNATGTFIFSMTYDHTTQWLYWINDNGVPALLYNYDDNDHPRVLSAGDFFARVRLCIDA